MTVAPFNPPGAFSTRDAVIAAVLRPLREEWMERTAIHHRVVHNSLWTVEAHRMGETTDIRIMEYEIGVYEGGALGFIARCEGKIRHASCPLAFLTDVPVRDKEWRKAVREYHAMAA